MDLKRKHDDRARVSPPPTKRKLQSMTTKTAVQSFFTPVSQKPAQRTAWAVVDETLITGHFDPASASANGRDRHRQKRRRIAAFDLDSTLIKTRSGKRFPDGATDWAWWDLSVPTRLVELDGDGYQVVIVSNQAGINVPKGSSASKADQKRFVDFKVKLESVLDALDIRVSVFAATERDKYRKPRTATWPRILDHFDLDDAEGPDLAESFFVGDAGGRASKDFSSSDRDFASNVGIKYLTPEEFFLGEAAQTFTRTFEPSMILESTPGGVAPEFRRDGQDVVVFCGSPGAGKSTFYWDILAPLGYKRVNQDNLKTRDRCLQAANDFLAKGESVAVDNTNAVVDTRRAWIELARRFKVPARCVLFQADTKLCEHNNAVRALNEAMNPEGRTMLPAVAFTSFAKRYQPPTLEEGFRDITVVSFSFRGTPEQKAIWSRYHI